MKTVYILLSLFIGVQLSAQDTKVKQFPEDYLGVYKGELLIENQNGTNKIAMEFHLNKTQLKDEFGYTLVYEINGQPSPRNYKLIRVNAEKGVFKIDENNRIVLDAKLSNQNTLSSIFEVQGNLLITTERFYDDYMLFEILFSKQENKVKTVATEEEIEVTSYPVTTTQTAKLIKQ